MIDILVMTHGTMAAGMCDSAQMILGTQEGLSALSFRPDWSLDTLIQRLSERLGDFGEDAQVLVLADLFGGTPSNAIVSVLGEKENVAAVTGANLPMLIEALMSRDDSNDAASLAATVSKVGREGIVDVRQALSD